MPPRVAHLVLLIQAVLEQHRMAGEELVQVRKANTTTGGRLDALEPKVHGIGVLTLFHIPQMDLYRQGQMANKQHECENPLCVCPGKHRWNRAFLTFIHKNSPSAEQQNWQVNDDRLKNVHNLH